MSKVGPEKLKTIDVDTSCASAKGSQTPAIVPSSKEIVKVKRKVNVLEENTARIEQLHNAIVDMLSKSLENAIEIGELLLEQKQIVKKSDGLFTKWAYEHLPFDIRTAQRYMKLYEYGDALRDSEVKTITEAYAYIFSEPVSDEVVEADDSLNITGISVEASVNLDEVSLSKKKARGMMKKVVLTEANINNMISGYGYQHCQEQYAKFVVELKSGSARNELIGKFVCAAEKYLRPSGKIILYKK